VALFTSAPLSSRILATASLSFVLAMYSGVAPVDCTGTAILHIIRGAWVYSDNRNGLHYRTLPQLTSAPRATSSDTTGACPSKLATCRGIHPSS
jgi:hypothetical protein